MSKNRFQTSDIPFDNERFTRRLLCELTDVLQQVIGAREARGFIAVVGARIGDAFNASYRKAAGDRDLTRPEVADALVDLKRRLGGRFRVVAQDDEELLFDNSRCPFGEAVKGRQCLCMMTSSVFGRIAAENLGYANVAVEESIAAGHGRCVVRVRLQPSQRADGAPGQEYFKVGSSERQASEETLS